VTSLKTTVQRINHTWNTASRTRQLWVYHDLPGLWMYAQAEAIRKGRSYQVPRSARRLWLINYIVKLEQLLN